MAEPLNEKGKVRKCFVIEVELFNFVCFKSSNNQKNKLVRVSIMHKLAKDNRALYSD